MDRDPLSFLDWDPDDEDYSSTTALDSYRHAREQYSGGDAKAALSTLDEGLTAVGLAGGSDREVALLLSKKAQILAESGRRDEALTLVDRLIELTDEIDEDDFQLVNVLCRTAAAGVRKERGEYDVALALLNDVVAAYGDDDRPKLRAAATSARAWRVHALVEQGRVGEARADWLALRASHGEDTETIVRAEVATAGMMAAGALLARRRTHLALRTADEVLALYRTETAPDIRAAVAIAIWARCVALRKTGRFIAFYRGFRDFARFCGAEPEPEIVEALRSYPGGESVVRNIRIFNS